MALFWVRGRKGFDGAGLLQGGPARGASVAAGPCEGS